MDRTINLPRANGTLESYALREPPVFTKPLKLESRTVYAAAHVVADPLAENGLGAPAVLDWESTLAFRHHLWLSGLGVAEAMDTAQRGMGLDWGTTKELIRRSAAEAKLTRSSIACGAGTDQLAEGLRVKARWAAEKNLYNMYGPTEATIDAARAHERKRIMASVAERCAIKPDRPQPDHVVAAASGHGRGTYLNARSSSTGGGPPVGSRDLRVGEGPWPASSTPS